jgi:hypothetical protein
VGIGPFRCDGQTGYRWHPPCRLTAQDLPGFRTLRPTRQLLHRVKGAPHRKAWIKSQCANSVACSSVCRRKCVQKSMRNLRQLCAPSRPPHWKPTSSFLPPGVAYVTRPPRQENAGQCAEVGKELVRPRTRRRDQGPSLTPRLLRQRGPDPPTLKAPSSRTIHGGRRFRSPH